MKIVEKERRSRRLPSSVEPQSTGQNPVEGMIRKLLNSFELNDVGVCYSARDIAIICVIADTGLYPVDLKLLRWSHIFPHYPHRTITEAGALSIPHVFAAPYHGKHSVKDTLRLVQIGDVTRTRLKDLLRPGTNLSDLVFKADRVRQGTKPKGSMAEKTMRNVWDKAKRDLGLNGLTMHKVREFRCMGYIRDLED